MSISMYQMLVPVTTHALRNLSAVLKKGEAFAKTKNTPEENLLQTRLLFDMLPLIRQVQIATDTVTRGAARLAGVEMQTVADTETSFAELCARLDAAIAYLESFQPEQIDGSETRDIHMKMRSGDLHYKGLDYLQFFILPNFFFHCTTTYAILRQSGVELGKRDFLGAQ
ncbi:MAG: DUF1993 domain-containing protein [Xanthomonadales bacterium]|nr:DUF1993 domain-containing protein [Xanthomonadales bacterium]